MRDNADRFESLGCEILGASFDTVAENLAFARAQRLPFRLLCDVDRAVGAAYQVLRPAGDPLAAYPERFAYLIDPHGVIRRSYAVSDVSDFARLVLTDLERLQERA
ncbi:MAG: peroxiredoxin family protein [Acidimicrobiales bacterium]|nr:peroxiredoxin family protein [Acidimicrobiales bacterium]